MYSREKIGKTLKSTKLLHLASTWTMQLTQAVDRYFNTGDTMKRDAHGYFYWCDRVGDTFRWKVTVSFSRKYLYKSLLMISTTWFKNQGENVSTVEVAEVRTLGLT